MSKLGVILVMFGTAAACKAPPPPLKPGERIESRPYDYHCKGNVDARLAVHPLGDKTGAELKLDGMDDVMISELTRSGCFQEVERDKDKMAVLFEEVDRCAPDAKDRERFDCSSFAQKGKQLGVTHFVFTDVVMYEPNVAAADLMAKVPAVGKLEANATYAAVIMNVRVVDVASGEVAAAAVIPAAVPSQNAGFEIGIKGASLKATASSSTPIGKAIMDMMGKSIEDLHDSWRTTTGNGAGSASASATPSK